MGLVLSAVFLLSPFQLIFEALRDGYLGHVALDDLSVKPGTCRAQEHCSFEASACGFTASGEHSWARQSNATGTAVTGPSTDHTTGTARGNASSMSLLWGHGATPCGLRFCRAAADSL